MPERTSLYQYLLVGVEPTPGGSPTSWRQMPYWEFTPAIDPDVETYRSPGVAFAQVASLIDERVEGTLRGPIDYESILWLASAVLCQPDNATPVDGVRLYTYSPVSDAANSRDTWTLHQAQSGGRAQQMAFTAPRSLNLNFDLESCTFECDVLAQPLEDDVTLVGVPYERDMQPVAPPHVMVYLADTAAGLAGASALERARRVQWGLTELYNPVRPLDGVMGYSALTDLAPGSTVKLLMAADAEGMALLTTMRDGATKFMRLVMQGESIGSGSDVATIQMDTALKCVNVSPFEDDDGLYAIEWEFEIAHDATWGRAMQWQITSEVLSMTSIWSLDFEQDYNSGMLAAI